MAVCRNEDSGNNYPAVQVHLGFETLLSICGEANILAKAARLDESAIAFGVDHVLPNAKGANLI